MRILSNFNRFGYTIAILPLDNSFLPTEKQLFVFERFSQDKNCVGNGRARLLRHLREEDDGKERGKRTTSSFPSPLALPLTELSSLILIGDRETSGDESDLE